MRISADQDIVDLTTTDLPQLRQLLYSNGLSFEDCHEQSNHFIGMFKGDRLIAADGIEYLGKTGLLRSVAVATDCRGIGLGACIVKQLQRRAARQGVRALYLLTETAAGYFYTLGYQLLNRENLPIEVTQTKQFSLLCPDSAQVMVIELVADKS